MFAQANRESPFDSWARWAVRQGQWKGPTVPWPALEIRPESEVRRSSLLAPVHVHATAGADRARMDEVLRAMEYVYAMFQRRGYPLPPVDGGRGGTPGFDLYLVSDSADLPDGVAARLDAADLSAAYDAGITHAQLDLAAVQSRMALTACVAQAISEAALLALDPAEAKSQRRASAALFSFYVTGRFGCNHSDEALQEHPEQGLATEVAGTATALGLGMIDARQRSAEGAFVADLWQFTRQSSANLAALRASPTLWEAMHVALENAGERMDELLVDLSIARYFSGSPQRRDQAPYPVLRALARTAELPLTVSLQRSALPAHVYAPEDLFPLGSAYVKVALPSGHEGEELRIWLRGDPGQRWSLAAMRLSAQGKERGRMTAPPRTTTRSYLPLVLTADTAEVVVVVTRLLQEVPDRGSLDAYGAGYQLILEYAAAP